MTRPALSALAALPAALALLGAPPAHAAEAAFPLRGADGFELPARLALPPGTTAATATRAIVILHGSGPQGMDGDLTAITKDRQDNKIYRDLAAALVAEGFAVLRYDKRSYVIREALRAKRPEADGWRKALERAPLTTLLGDARAAVGALREHLPKARLYVLGHSQGSFLALQAARTMPEIEGVALLGFMLHGLDTLAFEQITHRPMRLLQPLDTDGDGLLAPAELAKGGTIGTSLAMQRVMLDADGDGKLSLAEVQAGNLQHLLKLYEQTGPYTAEEAALPRPHVILREARFKVAFFQGLLDNQTPARDTLAIKQLAALHWQTPQERMLFRLYPGLGHGLDRRDGPDDLAFRPIDAKAKADLASTLAGFFD